jgi:alpha-1,6-mannosyltransferase
VTVSRFHPEKRLFTLLEAFKEARRSHDIGWVLYGHGPLRSAFDRKAAEVDGIHVAGFTENREELATALASCDAMLHGSAAETFGLVVAEGICSGLPVISPDIGGAADLVESNSGIHYRTGDAKDCARAIRSLVYNGRGFYEDGVQYAAERRVQTIDDHFQSLFSHYRSLKQSNQRAAS